MKLIDIVFRVGSLGGLVSAAFLIYDRTIRWRPVCYLCPVPEDFRVHLRIRNVASETVFIDAISITPQRLEIVLKSEVEAAAALIRPRDVVQDRSMVIGPSEEKSIPLTFQLQGLFDSAPIKLKVYWRTTRWSWPLRRCVRIKTSPKDIQRLFDAAKP
jgi:hypothetical protein